MSEPLLPESQEVQVQPFLEVLRDHIAEAVADLGIPVYVMPAPVPSAADLDEWLDERPGAGRPRQEWT